MTTRTLIIIGAAVLFAWPAAAAAQGTPDAALGAEVWSRNCVRCHNVRPSAERTDVQWMVIVSHMRARANLTRTQARRVTAFLQATNVPEGGGPDLTPLSEEGTAEGTAGTAEGGESQPRVQLSQAVLERLQAYLITLASVGSPDPR